MVMFGDGTGTAICFNCGKDHDISKPHNCNGKNKISKETWEAMISEFSVNKECFIVDDWRKHVEVRK